MLNRIQKTVHINLDSLEYIYKVMKQYNFSFNDALNIILKEYIETKKDKKEQKIN